MDSLLGTVVEDWADGWNIGLGSSVQLTFKFHLASLHTSVFKIQDTGIPVANAKRS